jgi:hypothetical protein
MTNSSICNSPQNEASEVGSLCVLAKVINVAVEMFYNVK